jgi:branched-chain amino acid transport system permease protein
VATLTRPVMRRAVRTGLIGGGVAVYCSAVGLVQRFEDRDVITDVIGLGRVLLVVAVAVFAYVSAGRPRPIPGQPEAPAPKGLVVPIVGALSGALTGAVVAALVLVGDVINLRRMFVSITPALLDLLAFGRGAVVGAVLLVAGGAILGLLAGSVHLLAEAPRRAISLGLATVLTMSLFSPLFDQIISSLEIPTSWLYRGDGVTIIGTIIVFIAVAGAIEVYKTRGQVPRQKFEALPEQQRKVATWVVALALIGFLFYLPQILGVFLSEVVGTIGLFVLLGLGLNIVIGYAGLLDLGYVAFFAVGAYATAILMSPAGAGGLELSFWVALPIVVIITTIVGILIGLPVLRLRGDYLAIVTLGFGEIARIVFISNWASPLTGGAQGILSIPDPVLFGIEFDTSQTIYYLILVAVIVAGFVSIKLADSRVGRSWNAMREDEDVAEAMGLSIVRTKLSAFAMGAAIGSLGGVFFAVKIGSVFPHSFNILVSIQALSLIILGGMGNIWGVVVGAAVLVGLPELLREFAEFRLLLYGGILVAIMLIKPEGLLPSARRRRELHVEELEEEQYEKRAGAEAAAPAIAGGAGEAT